MNNAEKRFTVMVPPTIRDASDDIFNEFYSLIIAIFNTYASFIERGIPEEDVRCILPNCLNVPEENKQEARE